MAGNALPTAVEAAEPSKELNSQHCSTYQSVCRVCSLLSFGCRAKLPQQVPLPLQSPSPEEAEAALGKIERCFDITTAVLLLLR